MKIAVVGGGLFGCTAALVAAKVGHHVDLYEASGALMGGATAHGFARLHRGYHYPRSPETGRESRAGEDLFRAAYGDAVIDRGQQEYVVAPGSKVTFTEFLAFCDAESLPYETIFGRDAVRVKEGRINVQALQAIVRYRVARESNVRVFLDSRVDRGLDGYDQIIVAAYAGINDVLRDLGHFRCDTYKFQLVERPVILFDADQKMHDKSIVVIDGPFGCVDPLDDSPLHILGHVTETILDEYEGVIPRFDRDANRGLSLAARPKVFERARDALVNSIPELSRATYIGSSLTVRAVLAGESATDRRPTLVRRVSDKIVSIFSGKLGTAVDAAYRALALCEGVDDRAGRDRIQHDNRAKFAVVNSDA